MSIAYRPATKGDIDGIVTVFLDCWRGSYRAVLPERLIDAMTDRQANDLWTRVLSEAAAGEVLVAELSEPTLATSEASASSAAASSSSLILGVTRFAAGPAGHGAVHSLYVSPHAQGMGVGSRLLRAAGDALADAGMLTASLWVFRENAPSVAFYQHQGWTPTGETRVQAEFGEPELSLTRALTEPRIDGNAP